MRINENYKICEVMSEQSNCNLAIPLEYAYSQISLFSKLSLNDRQSLLRDHKSFREFSGYDSELEGASKKRRKLSEEILKDSKNGDKNYLNRSLVGNSSINNQAIAGLEKIIKRDSSQISCPVEPNQDRSAFFDSSQQCKLGYSAFKCENDHLKVQDEKLYSLEQKPRFTKTKNLLRNIGNYFHKFLMYNQRAQCTLRQYFKKLGLTEPAGDEQIRQFCEWVRSLSLINFTDYEHVWLSNHKYRGLYRMMCFKYYTQQAYCDIQRSRLTTKEIANSLLSQFIEGLRNPKVFNRFK